MAVICSILAYLGYGMHINWFIKSIKDWFLLVPLLLWFFLFPDIDSPSSLPRAIITMIGLSFIIFYALQNQIWVVVAIAVLLLFIWVARHISKDFQHRGVVHSILFGLLASLLLLYFNWTWCILGFIAFLSHLVIDFFTGGKGRPLKLWN